MTTHQEIVSPVFTPLKLSSNLTIKNRLLRSSISGMFDDYNGHGTQARINWEERFARGGVGAIISSFVPVAVEGRILPRYAMIDDDDKIPFWRKVGEVVKSHDCAFLLQLSHSGRQQDIGGVENLHKRALSSTDRSDFFHGIPCQSMTPGEILRTVAFFAEAARRAKEAGLDGVELHGANGYLLTQFLSKAINDRQDEYGGSNAKRARFVLEIVRAIRQKVGPDFHLQMKINAIDDNHWLGAVYPGERAGNRLEDTVEICRILRDGGKGVDAFHISSGSTFPHPRNPPGEFPADEVARWYDVMLSQGSRARFNDWIFSNPVLSRAFSKWWAWWRGPVIEGINAVFAREIRAAVGVPVLCTGGFQTGSVIAEVIREGWCDAVCIARPLIANPDLPEILKNRDLPPRPCSYCNKCLVNDLENPLGCYDVGRYPAESFEQSYQAMMDEVFSIFNPPAFT